MSTSAPTETIPPIDGIEQMDTPAEGSKAFTTIYYSDKRDALIKAAMELPVRENHFIAPAVGWPKRLYRRAAKP